MSLGTHFLVPFGTAFLPFSPSFLFSCKLIRFSLVCFSRMMGLPCLYFLFQEVMLRMDI